jgi:multicomponent Na+:H+ antiporter subunit F
MSTGLIGLAALMILLVGVKLIRVIRGPTVFDRFLAVGAIGTDAVLILVVLGMIYERPDGYIDLALTYAILNFIGVVAVAKFLDPGERSTGPDEEVS